MYRVRPKVASAAYFIRSANMPFRLTPKPNLCCGKCKRSSKRSSNKRLRPRKMSNRDLFEMANLYPDTTGLPMTVWVSPRGNARHDVRVKVNMAHGNQMNIANTAVVGVRPTPRVIAGQLSPPIHKPCSSGSLNTDVLVAYWDGQIDTARMIQGLKPLPLTQPGQPSTP